MTESQLELRLRDWYRAAVPENEPAPQRLRRELAAIVTSAPQPPMESVLDRLRATLSSRTLQFGALAAAVVAIAVIGLSVLSQQRPDVGTTPLPVLPSPSALPTGSSAPDRTLGTWSPGTPMNGARAMHTTTLLADGRVLVTGGTGPHGIYRQTILATAEIYDPASRTWAPVVEMPGPRSGHTATLLADGRVLVTGGSSGDSIVRIGQVAPEKSAYVYDPASNTWTPTGLMSIPHQGHHAVLLDDGRVLVTGGEQSEGAVAAAEIWDPRNGAWTSTGNGPFGGSFRIPVVLSDGRVLIAGDYDGTGNSRPYSQIYDPDTDAWFETAPMSRVLWQTTMTLLGDGRVLVAGGQEPESTARPQIVSTAELYDPTSDSWSLTGSMTVAHFADQALLLNNGTVLVVGRQDFGEVYVPADGLWRRTAPLAALGSGSASTLLLDGTVMTTGGFEANTVPEISLSTTQIFDPFGR